MLYYSSLHPDWDYQDTHGGSARIQQISALLSAITMNHYRNTGHCFEALEQAGVILGCGGFEAVLIQSDPMGQIEEHPGWSQQLIKAASELLPFPLWYCFSVSGRLYILVCTPGFRSAAQTVTPSVSRSVPHLPSCRSTCVRSIPTCG